MADHDARSEELIVRVFDGGSEGLSRDDILRQHDPVLADQHRGLLGAALLVHAAAGARAASSTSGACRSGRGDGVSGRDLSTPRSWAVRAYPKLLRYNRLPKGGHFAAWEQPETFVSELRAGFTSLRSV